MTAVVFGLICVIVVVWTDLCGRRCWTDLCDRRFYRFEVFVTIVSFGDNVWVFPAVL